jgi:hypothetical protein
MAELDRAVQGHARSGPHHVVTQLIGAGRPVEVTFDDDDSHRRSPT